MKDKFKFDPETHIYKLNNRILPSVNQIIKAIFGSKFWYDPWYAERGKAIHLAVHYLANNKLNRDSLDYDIIPRIQAFEKFIAETGFEIIDSEVLLFSRLYRFAGQPDLILKDNNDLIIVHVKSSI